jgi:uncharacterized Rmd1/YagE family protein
VPALYAIGSPSMQHDHRFHAVAFEENLDLKQLATWFHGAKVSAHDMRVTGAGDIGGETFLFPFGAVVFHDVESVQRDVVQQRIRQARPGLTAQVVREEYTVREDGTAKRIGFGEDGTLVVDRMTPGRASVIALTVAQSAAMEYYERIVDSLYVRTSAFVQRLESRGTVPMRVRPLHRFIGEAVSTRSEVLEVLHLLDKPDAAWDDPSMSDIYDDLRGEFDLADRYRALESKLRSIQEALELLLDVVRDRRLVLLEAAIVALIAFDIVMSLTGVLK